MNDGLFTIDSNHLCTFINDAALEILGYRREQCIGKNMHELVHGKYPNGDCYPESKCSICQTFFNKESYRADDAIFWKADGSSLPIKYTSNQVFDNEQLVGVLVIFSDISYYKKNEAEIRKIRNDFENLINATDDIIWSIDSNYRLISFNNSYKNRVALFSKKDVKVGDNAIIKGFGVELSLNWERYYHKALNGEKFKVTEQMHNPLLNELQYELITFDPMYREGVIYGVACYSKNITEDVDYQKSMHDAYTELENIFNQSIDIICTIDKDGCFLKLSAACEKIWGFSPDVLIGKRYLEHVHPEDISKTVEFAKETMDGKQPTHFENRYLSKGGEIIPMLWSAKWDNKYKIMYCIARDNTDKIIADKKLAESAAFLKEAQHLAKMGSWNFDFKTDKLTWSDELFNVFDTDNKTFLETHGSFIHLIDESDRLLALKASKRAQQTGEPFNIQYNITTAKGEKRIIEEFGYGEKDKSGNVIRLFGTAQDITQRRLSEIALQQSEARMRGIIASQTNYVIRTDLLGNYSYCNQKFITDFGWLHKGKSEELIGINCLSSIMPYHHQAVIALVEKCFSNPNKIFQIEIDKPGKNNSVKTTLWDFILLTNENGQPEEIQCVGIDITARKKAENKLTLLNEYLQKQANDLKISNAELEQFAFIASHDLQEPLRMITSFLTQLERKYHELLDEKGKKYIYFAVDGAQRMRQIIMDLLEYSRVGRITLNSENTNPKSLIEDVIALYKNKIMESSAIIKVNKLPTVYADKVLLRQVFQNLIGNALKYQKQSTTPKITISCKDKPDHWVFAVSDNGIGIEAEYFDQIFIIFKRLHIKEEYSGTGIGLAITKKMIENLGGSIWVESKKDKGSIFYFSIPKNNKP
mgnify:CR=1 FL=1